MTMRVWARPEFGFGRLLAESIRFHQNRTVSWVTSMPCSWSRSSTFRSDSGKRIYIITARRIISGDVLKYLNGLRICGGYETGTPRSS
jgi:hypothetical protein